MRIFPLVGGLALGLLSGEAFASITVTNYTLPDSASMGSVTTLAYNGYTGPIVLQTSVGEITVYCADLQHEIYPNQTYAYSYGLLNENGLGETISQTLSNELGQIAGIGKNALAGGDDDMAAAAQAAIWALEYSVTPTFGDPTGQIATDYESLVTRTYANDGTYAEALIPTGWPNPDATQQMIIGAPELSTWAMMAVGFAGLAFAGYSGRRPAIAIA